MSAFESRRFGDLPGAIAARFPEREALVFEERRHTFAQVSEAVDAAARALLVLGVNAGDHIALWLNNRDDWIFIMYAIARIGAVQVPFNTRFRTRDLEYVLRQSDCRMLITHDQCGPIDYLEIVRAVVDLPVEGSEVRDCRNPELRQVVIVSEREHAGTVAWHDALAAGAGVAPARLADRAAAVRADQPTLIMYTSGTTGFPKGAMHDHRLIRNVEERASRMGITEHDVVLNYLPLFHVFGYSEGALMCMVTGARHVVTETFDPSACLDLVESEGVTIMHGFEAHQQALTAEQERAPRDLAALRTGIFAAGMQSATPVGRRAAHVLSPLRSLSGFGMTEVWLGVALCRLDDDQRHRTETSGYPGLGYEVRVVDPETAVACAVDVPGELQVRGRYLMIGYYRKPEETAAAYTEDGWFRTGDMAVLLADGYIRFLGRYKDMLKVGGENVDPMEVEGLLLEHPEVEQVAVVGCPHDRLSEVAVAFVMRRPESRLEANDVIEHCRGRIASFKVPRLVVFVEDLPMTASGKIRKVDLRVEAVRQFAPHTSASAPVSAS